MKIKGALISGYLFEQTQNTPSKGHVHSFICPLQHYLQ